MNRQNSGRQDNGGFALVIVLWVLAGLTVVAVAVAASVHSNATSVKLLRDRVEAEQAFLSTASRIKVMASTAERRTSYLISNRGLLYLDGRMTKVSSQESVVLQDGFGLVNLNNPDASAWNRLLLYCGADERNVGQLIDGLADYVDADSLKRLNGAEAFEYASAELRPPRNARLLSKEELWRVKGWQAIKAAWTAKNCDELVTVHGNGGFNRNTAQMAVLLAGGLTEAQAEALLDARLAGLSSQGTTVLDAIAGSGASPFGQARGSAVGSIFRVRHEQALLEWNLQYEIELTPNEPGGPWRMYEMRIVPPMKSSNALRALLPSVDYLLSERERAELNAVSASPFGH